MPASNQYWCRTESILREHPGDSRPRSERHQQKIGAVGLANAGGGDAEGNTSDRMELFSRRWREIDWHE